MNENLNLVEILKDRPKGTKLYSPALGEVEFAGINYHDRTYPIMVKIKDGTFWFTKQGKFYNMEQSECLLFPSKEQRDWSKFNPNKPKFDPKTLKPFDKVLVCNCDGDIWRCSIFSHIYGKDNLPSVCNGIGYKYCILYNDDTKHLAGTNKEAPEFYRYWED